jgi:MFS family permease
VSASVALHESAVIPEARTAPRPLYRWVVLGFVSLTMFGNYYVCDALGLVADLVKTGFGITDAQYGLLTGIYSMAAVLVLLLGGVLIDRIGTKRSVLLFGSITAAAGVIMALAPNYRWMFLGRFILGVGAEPLGVAVTTALARWFRGREIAFAFGINLTLARLGSVAADRSPQWAHDVYRKGGAFGFGHPLWLAAGIGLTCVLGGIVYWALERHAEQHYILEHASATEKLRLSDLTVGFGVSYWLVVGLCFTFYSAILPFQSFAIKFFIEAHGTPREQAGALLSYLPLTAMIATPVFGLLADRVGRRGLFMLIGSLLIAPAYALMATRSISLYLPIALMGTAFALIPAILWPAVAYLVEETRLGTAYSLMTLLQQVGFFVVSWGLGWANDSAGASANNPAGYGLGMWLLTGLSFLGLVLSSLLWHGERGPRTHGLETIAP